jgi:uncharacterized protein YndB with AHSA1/START domain
MPTPSASLTVRKILPCRPEKAFRAWTEPAQFQQWFAPHPEMKVIAEFDLQRGGKYRIGFQRPEGKPTLYVGGEFVVIDAPHRLEYTWIWEKESNPEWKDRSVVKVTFTPLDSDRTEIVLTHEKFSDPEECESHTEGWTKILDRMAAAMAG